MDWVSAFGLTGYFMEFKDVNFSFHQQILLRTHSSTPRWQSGYYCSRKACFHKWHRRIAIQSSSPEQVVPSALSSLHMMVRKGKTGKKNTHKNNLLLCDKIGNDHLVLPMAEILEANLHQHSVFLILCLVFPECVTEYISEAPASFQPIKTIEGGKCLSSREQRDLILHVDAIYLPIGIQLTTWMRRSLKLGQC